MATKYIVNNLSGQTINGQQLQPYKVYTALLTQSGGDSFQSITGGTLTIGVTYQINSPGAYSGWDFTNVGAPNNNTDTYFVATGTTPNSWGADGALAYNTGAPVVTVLENTLGNVWFTYQNDGQYDIKSSDIFTNGKTFVIVGSTGDDIYAQTYIGACSQLDSSTLRLVSALSDGQLVNGIFLNTPIEIRVYN